VYCFCVSRYYQTENFADTPGNCRIRRTVIQNSSLLNMTRLLHRRRSQQAILTLWLMIAEGYKLVVWLGRWNFCLMRLALILTLTTLALTLNDPPGSWKLLCSRILWPCT